MKVAIVRGTTSWTTNVYIRDTRLSDNSGLTGLVYNSSGLTAYYDRPKAASAAITLATQTVTGAWSSGGFVEIDATNMPGMYRFDVPDAALATGVDAVTILLKGAANMAALAIEIQLTVFDLNSASNAVGAASSVSGAVGSVTGAVGSVTGAVGSVTAVVSANLTQILGTALTETAGYLAAGFKKFFNIAAPVSTVGSVDQTGDSYARIGSAGAGLTAIGDTRMANLDATVSSRSTYAGGAVASVTAPVALTAAYDAAKTAAQPSDIPSATSVADATLKRDWALVTGEADHSLMNVLRGFGTRNKVVRSGGTITVYKEDGTTVAYTVSITASGSAQPIVGTDPV